MDWNTFELTAFFVLSLAPIVVLALTGRFVRLKQSRVWLNWYLPFGLLCSAALMFFGGPVTMKVFPPPYVPGLSDGRGLDLRGLFVIFGSWVGGVAGLVTTAISFVLAEKALMRTGGEGRREH